jgi:adenylate kinase family enzyme
MDNAMKILIMGLPGSGKTALAGELTVELIRK